jgi:hypothetical protein
MVQARNAGEGRHRHASALSSGHDDAGDSDALLVGKRPEATPYQLEKLRAAVFGVLRKRNGGAVVGDGPRGAWRLKEAA